MRANRGESVRLRGRRRGGIAKLRMDWDRAINVGEAAGGWQWGWVAKRAGVRSRWDELYF